MNAEVVDEMDQGGKAKAPFAARMRKAEWKYPELKISLY